MARASVTIIRGDSWQRVWVIKDAAEQVIDISGVTARLQVRDSSDNLFLAATEQDMLTVDGPAGTVTLLAPYTAAETIPVGSYFFDLELTYPLGVRVTYEQGRLVIIGDVTRDIEP